MNHKIPVEDRVWAVIAHLSAIAMGMGILLPVIGWSESRRKSNYASFQCMQALGYQSLGYTIWILTTLVVVIIVSISAVAGIANAANSENLESELIVLAFAHTTLMFGLIGVYFILPIIAAIACALGKDFRYPIMGNRLAKYLGHEQVTSDENDIWLNEEHEDRWVASMGHFSVIIMLWGLLVPATAWIMQGKRSTFLKFQSAQTIMFQATTLLLYFLSGILYVGGFLFFLLAVGGMEAINLDTGFGMIGLLVLFGSLICTFVIVLIIPLLHIMGQWAGYRVLKGDDYRYPVVGKWAEKWLSRGTMPSKAETSS
jgi:uncharacterized Tic20 family protein